MAQSLAADIIQLTFGLPRNSAAASISKQIAAAAGSVGSNIAEGHGRFSLPAYKNHLSIAKGSACEVDCWLDLLRRVGMITPEREQALHERSLSLIALLTSKMRALEARMPSKARVGEEPEVYGDRPTDEQLS